MARVHKNHAHIKGTVLFLILLDSFLGWPGAINASDSTVKQILRTIWST